MIEMIEMIPSHAVRSAYHNKCISSTMDMAKSVDGTTQYEERVFYGEIGESSHEYLCDFTIMIDPIRYRRGKCIFSPSHHRLCTMVCVHFIWLFK